MGRLVDLKLPTGKIVGVSEYKKSTIEKYLKVFPEYPEILKVFLFGSSLEERCTPESDIDLWMILNDESDDVYFSLLSKIWEEHDWSTYDDLLACGPEWFRTHDAGALGDVKKKGVLLYDSM